MKSKKNYAVVVDSSCSPCLSIGQDVSTLAGIEILPLSSDRFDQLMRKYGLSAEPALLALSPDGALLHRYTGWRMRVKMSQLIGTENADKWISLLLREQHARTTRKPGFTGRRNILLGALALGAGIMGAGATGTVAHAQPLSTGQSVRPARMAEARAILQKSGALQECKRIVGDFDQATWIEEQGHRFLALNHPRDGAQSFIDAYRIDSAAILRPQQDRVEFLLHTGVPLGEFHRSGQSVTFQPSESDPSNRPTEVQPQAWQHFARCIADRAALDIFQIEGCYIPCQTGINPCIVCLGPAAARWVADCWNQR